MADETRIALSRLRADINSDPDRFTGSYFARLFALDPSVRDLFPTSLVHVRNGFHRVVDHVLEVMLAPIGHADLVDLLAQLGRDHRKYGVTDDHYALANRALIAEFAFTLGPAWTRTTAAAVEQTTSLITGVMGEAAQRATRPAVTRARITEKFQISREHAVIRLLAQAPLDYLPGQYVEAQIPQWPREWRMLSPSTPASDTGEVEFHVRAIPGGTVSKSIVLESQVDDVWSIAQNHGTLHVDLNTPTTMIAGGTGIAPLRAILLDLCANVQNPPVHLYYGARHPGELYELPALRRLALTNPWLTITAVTEETADPWWLPSIATPADLGFRHLIGTLAQAIIHDAGASPQSWGERDFLLSGSPAMIEVTERKLIIAGARASRIHHDAM